MTMGNKKIAMVGLGYIGLPTALVLSGSGYSVIGVDTNKDLVNSLNTGKYTSTEPHLNEALAEAYSQNKFSATTDMPVADIFIIAVPTPLGVDNEADLTYVEDVVYSIAPVLSGGELIILESTSPPKTTEHLAHLISKLRPDLHIDGLSEEQHSAKEPVYIAYCPERVLPGDAFRELIENSRTIGGISPAATELAISVYRSFCTGALSATDAITAELTKLTENSFRDVNIAFANELSMICDDLNVNVWELISLANQHPRVNILSPGPGVGGHCIAVDPWFLASSSPKNSRLIQGARAVNLAKTQHVIQKVQQSISDFITLKDRTPRVALFGLSFKPDIDDMRESPALEIALHLANEYPRCDFIVSEPNLSHLPDSLSRGSVSLAPPEQAILAADIIVLLVSHTEFRSLPHPPKNKIVIDTQGLWK